MSARYRATFNVVTDMVEPAYAAALSTIDSHCIVSQSNWYATGTSDVAVLTFTYYAASDVEALAIVQDAGKATGRPFDAVKVTANHGRRAVTP